jgi:hypothetical protein
MLRLGCALEVVQLRRESALMQVPAPSNHRMQPMYLPSLRYGKSAADTRRYLVAKTSA